MHINPRPTNIILFSIPSYASSGEKGGEKIRKLMKQYRHTMHVR